MSSYKMKTQANVLYKCMLFIIFQCFATAFTSQLKSLLRYIHNFMSQP